MRRIFPLFKKILPKKKTIFPSWQSFWERGIFFGSGVFVPVFPVSAAETLTEVGSVSDFGEFLSEVWSWAAEVIFGFSVLALVIGGILFITANGDEQKTDWGKTTIKGGIVSLLLVLFSAVLQTFLAKPTANISGESLSETSIVITNTITLFLGIIGVLAVLGILNAGIRLMMSGGDEDQQEKAKRSLKLSLFGAMIALGAWSLLHFLLRIWK